MRDNLATRSPDAHSPAADHDVARDRFANGMAAIGVADQGNPGMP
jgi:hypothetical protein